MTSPCEEYFEDRHFDKIARYEALCVSIIENGWRHHLFAIEVGARGYCAYNVRSCIRRLNSHRQLFSVLPSFGSLETTKFGMNKQPLHLIYLRKLHESIPLSKIKFLNIPMQNIHNLYLNSIDQDSLIRVTLVT